MGFRATVVERLVLAYEKAKELRKSARINGVVDWRNGPMTRSDMPRPFREIEVEEILVGHLQRDGYSVRRRVRVDNGIIDVVAHGPVGRWVIEVKGEDAGGITSAEMNLQGGIGQIVSRMVDSSSRYALAIPMTGDFERVLRKYKGSFGLERLGLCFFVVHRDGRVDAYDAAAMTAYLGTM